MADDYLVDASGTRALVPWNEWLKSYQAHTKKSGKPDLTQEQIDHAHKAWFAAARKSAGLEDEPKTPTAAPTPPPDTQNLPPYLRRPATSVEHPGGAAEAEAAGRAVTPPPPPKPPPGDSGAMRAFRALDFPVEQPIAEGIRTIERPFEYLGGKVTEAIDPMRARHAVAEALARRGVPKAAAKVAGNVAKGAAELPGGFIGSAPQLGALAATPELDVPFVTKYVPKALKYIPKAFAKGAVFNPIDYLAKARTGEAPEATPERLAKEAVKGGTQFVEFETGGKLLGTMYGGPKLSETVGKASRQGVDWFEGSKDRPVTEKQATPDQPTPPVRQDQDPAFVKELNKEETPPTAGKKEPSAPSLGAQNERTDKPGSGAGGTDPDDPGTHPKGGEPTSSSVPPGVAPGDIRESDAVNPTAPGPGTSEQGKPRRVGPIRDYFRQLEQERIEAQRAADDAAHTAEVGPRRPAPGMPRNIEDLRRQLRGEPEEPAAPPQSRYRNLPRTLMDLVRSVRGYESPRPAAPAAPRGPVVEPPVTGDAWERLVTQLRGQRPEDLRFGPPKPYVGEPGPFEATRNAPVGPEQNAMLAQREMERRNAEAEEAARAAHPEKERQAAEQAELAQRVRNRQEREQAAGSQSRLLRLLARDREQAGAEATRQAAPPGIEWTGPVPPREPRPEDFEGYRWPTQEPPPKPPRAPKPKPPPEPVESEEPRKPAPPPPPPPPVESEPEPEPEPPKEPPKATPDQLQAVVRRAADSMRDAPSGSKDRGHYRKQLRQAARALKEMMGEEEAGRFVRDEVGDGPVTRALQDILGEQYLKRPKPAAPGRPPGRGAEKGKGPTATTAKVLPEKDPFEPGAIVRLANGSEWEVVDSNPEHVTVRDPDTEDTMVLPVNAVTRVDPRERQGIFAVRTEDGTVYSDPDAVFHVDVMDKHGVDPDKIRDTGFIWQGKYAPGNPIFNKRGEMTGVKPPGGLAPWIDPESVSTWKQELEQRRKEKAGELEPDPDEEVSLRGNEGTIQVEGFPKTPFRYEVVERDDLVTSHDTNGNPNPDYPAGLQQRALDRAGYRATQRKIRTEMNPELLGASPSAIEGAPVVSHTLEGNVVLGGKQRTAHLQGLEEGSDADETYQNWLYQHAKDFGIDPAGLEQFARPTLIRRLTRRLTPEEARRFAPNTDVSPSTELSPSEKARMDAARLTPAMLEKLEVTDSGSLNTEGNLGFIRAFMGELPETEQNRLTQRNGFLNDDGLRRVQNAVLARAYSVGDELHPAVTRMFESSDSNVKTIQHALLRAAPEFAIYRGLVDTGELDLVDVMSPLLDASSTVSALRTQGMKIQDWLNQGEFGGKDPTETKVMQLLADNTNVPDLTEALKDVARYVTNLPRKSAGDLFERPKTPTPAQIFDLVRDPDRISEEAEDRERIQQSVRDLDRDIRTARDVGDFEKVERLQEQKKKLRDEEPC